MYIRAILTLICRAQLLAIRPLLPHGSAIAHNDAGQKWSVTKERRSAGATFARQLCVGSGANGSHCVVRCQGGGWRT